MFDPAVHTYLPVSINSGGLTRNPNRDSSPPGTSSPVFVAQHVLLERVVCSKDRRVYLQLSYPLLLCCLYLHSVFR